MVIERYVVKGHKENFEREVCVLFLDGKVSWVYPYASSDQIAYINMCNLFYVDQRRQWHPTPVLLPGKSHGRRSLEGCSSWGC